MNVFAVRGDMATLHSGSTGGGVASGTAGGRTSVGRTPISASLPSLFARTLPTQSNRRRQSQQPPGRLVSTECQTEEDSSSVQQNVRVENARNETTAGVLLDPSGRRPVSQLSESGVEETAELERGGPPRRRRREKRRHRRSQVPAQPLQQHVQQALQDQQTELSAAAPVSPSNSDHLPDILNAHMPPPYSTLPHNSERCMGMGPIPITALPVPLSVVPMAIAGPSPAGGGLLIPPTTTTPAVVPPSASLLAASNSFTLPPAGGRR